MTDKNKTRHTRAERRAYLPNDGGTQMMPCPLTANARVQAGRTPGYAASLPSWTILFALSTNTTLGM